MELNELVSVLGPVGGVALYMWLNRDKTPKSDPVAAKLDAIHSDVAAVKADVALIKDRTDR